jgi:PAS domain S-box-containing protein
MLIQGEDQGRPPCADAPVVGDVVVPNAPTGTTSRKAPAPKSITLVGGLLVAAVGVTTMVAWLLRVTPILRFGSQNPISFNTTLAFTITGIALAVFARGWWPRAVQMAGVFDAVLFAVILAEYASGHGLGVDQLIAKAYIAGPHDVPGRPAVNTSVCLVLVGLGLLVWGPWRRRRRPAVLAAAASVIAVIAVAATFGYATGNPKAYGWTHVTAMAFITAVTMLVLATSLLSAAWRDSRAHAGGLPRWLPMPAGALALGLAAWLLIDGRAVAAGRISAGTFTGAATVLGLVLTALVVLVVWVGQQAERRRLAAVASGAQQAKAEAVARASEHRLFQFLDVMPVGVFIASPGGQPYYASDEGERLLGRGVNPDIGGAALAEVYSVFQAGTDRQYPTESVPIVQALAGHESHVDDVEIRRPDGSVVPLEVWGRPVYGADGQIDYGIAAFADMSERNAREKTIAGQAALLELAHDAIFIRQLGGRIAYWNLGAEHTYGFTSAEAMEHMSHDLLRTQFPEPIANIEATVARDGRWDGELIQRRADERTIIVESRWAAHRGPDGSLLGFMETNRDITAKKNAEREMLRGADEVRALNTTLEERVRQRTVYLQRANRNLAAFTYSIAHDLRTPLRAVSGYAELLVEDYGDRLEETGRGYAGLIQSAGGQMAAVLDDLLHLSQVSRAEMNLQDVDLSAEVTAICDQLRARDPGRRVRMTVEDGVRATVDRSLIRTALEKLLDNAWKFTNGGEQAAIEFGTTPVDDAPFCCYVRDNGAGFDPAYAHKLFQPFQRLHAASEFPGTGIGLASAQRIIDRHGGRAWAEGAVGSGATIYFTLDAKDMP